MSAEKQLAEAYDRWEVLALAEAEAIRARDWPKLAACQETLGLLRPEIDGWLGQARLEWAGAGSTPSQAHFRARVRQLTELAQQNRALLEQTYRSTLNQLDQLGHTRQTLRRLRASYSRPTPAAWSSFS